MSAQMTAEAIKVGATIADLAELPLSPNLLAYYRERLQASEDEMRSLHGRIDACGADL